MSRRRTSALPRIGIASLSVMVVGAAAAMACAFYTEFRTVAQTAPADPVAFDRGALGVVRPAFEKRYLIQAYRTLNGGAPHVDFAPLRLAPPADPTEAVARWREARDLAAAASGAGTSGAIEPARWLDNNSYQAFNNCLTDSFDGAAQTLNTRVLRYGAASREVRDWIKAQDAVFANCGGTELTVPVAPDATAGEDERADRAYQTASAYFYALNTTTPLNGSGPSLWTRRRRGESTGTTLPGARCCEPRRCTIHRSPIT